MRSIKDILKTYWGFDSFRDPQQAIIESVLNGNDTVALLPTGGGKSICFQIPTLAKAGVCVVISPLIALMEDQVNTLKNKGIKATTIPSGSHFDDIIRLFDNIKFGNYKFLYISPERLQSKLIQQKICQLDISLVAIDEAHCISEWGHDFRPSYTQIHLLRPLLPDVPFIALTATATSAVLKDINDLLNLNNPTIFKKSFLKSNLGYQLLHTEDKLYKLKLTLSKIKSNAIVYVSTRQNTKEISNYLNANNFSSSFYHGGLTSAEKKEAFDNWMTEKTPIIVATNAFGMGIDKSNVGIVIHLNIPNSIENYVQEAGRAGRNGEKAYALMLVNQNDIRLKVELQQKSLPSIDDIKLIHQKLYQHYQISRGELIDSPFEFNLLNFCNKYLFTPNKTFNTLQILHNNGVITIAHQNKKMSSIQFLVTSTKLMHYSSRNKKLQHFIKTLLRMYIGVFDHLIPINEYTIAKTIGITSGLVVNYLDKLADEEIITYNKPSKNSELLFLQPREDDKTINRISKHIVTYLNTKKAKTKELITFIQNDSICKSIQILNYFGEQSDTKCGICNVCTAQKPDHNTIANAIITLLDKHNAITSKQICLELPYKEADILITLRYLLTNDKVGLNTYNNYFLR